MRDEFNQTLLRFAVGYNRTSCIRVLLRFASHHLDAGDEDNGTPLMYTVRNETEMLRAGADILPKTK